MFVNIPADELGRRIANWFIAGNDAKYLSHQLGWHLAEVGRTVGAIDVSHISGLNAVFSTSMVTAQPTSTVRQK